MLLLTCFLDGKVEKLKDLRGMTMGLNCVQGRAWIKVVREGEGEAYDSVGGGLELEMREGH